MKFVRKRLLERLATVSLEPMRLLADVLGLMLVTVQRGLTEMAVRVGELNQEVIETVRPDPAQGAELAAHREDFHALSLRFPGYLVNAQAALLDPPRVEHTPEDNVERIAGYVQALENTQGLIDSVEESVRNVARDLQAQTATWQGNQVNVLTALAAVFIPITFITSYFGMNFDWMIDRVNSGTHFLLFGVGLMIIVLLIAVGLLRRNGYALTVEERVGEQRAHQRRLRRPKLVVRATHSKTARDD